MQTPGYTYTAGKRVSNMAFLTLISPLVALMYPIDKQDGKADGFSSWLKEYIYNALLQPFHYLLYTIMITSAISLAANKINDLLNKKLTQNIVQDDIPGVLALIDSVAKKITEVPALVKALGLAYENLRTEEETKMARGGVAITSSMDADSN